MLPLIPLLGAIFGGIGAAGAVAGGATKVAKAVNDKKAQEAQQKEAERHNRAVEQMVSGAALSAVKGGEGVKEVFTKDIPNLAKAGTSFIKSFTNKLADEKVRKPIKNILKTLSDHISIEPTKDGNGLILNPYPRG